MRPALIFLFLLVSMVGTTSNVLGQRDYLTAEEIELVRDAQEIDKRISVLVYAIDRRFAALKIESKGTPPGKKEIEKWGELPASTRSELLWDIKRILQKAVDDIDNLAERPASAYIVDKDDRNVGSFEKLFPKAMRSLATAANRFSPLLKAELDKENTPHETGSLLDSVELCDEIAAAVKKLGAEPAKKN